MHNCRLYHRNKLTECPKRPVVICYIPSPMIHTYIHTYVRTYVRTYVCMHARMHGRTSVARIFVWGGLPGRRHPPLHQSCTRLNFCRRQIGVCERSCSQQSHRWSPRMKKLDFFLAVTSKEPVCPRVELILKIIIILLIIFLGFIKSKPC